MVKTNIIENKTEQVKLKSSYVLGWLVSENPFGQSWKKFLSSHSTFDYIALCFSNETYGGSQLQRQRIGDTEINEGNSRNFSKLPLHCMKKS